MKNAEGDTSAAALREANLRIDKLSIRAQALEEVDGKITTSRSSSSETEGEIWNWQNGSWGTPSELEAKALDHEDGATS